MKQIVRRALGGRSFVYLAALWLLALLLPTAARAQTPTVKVTPAGPLTLCAGSTQTLTATATVPGFNVAGTGANSEVYAVAVQADGKVLVGGAFTAYNGSAAPAGVLRLNADGSLDSSFNPGGAGANSVVYALAVQADGKVLVGGRFTSYNGNAAAPNRLLRLNPDGSLDTSFNPGGAGADNDVTSVAVQPDGKVLVGGFFASYNGNTAPGVVLRLNPDGSLDISFNPGGAGANNDVRALVVQPDGKVLVGGFFASYNGNTAAPDYVLRLNADGSLDPSFNNGGTGANVPVYALALQADGKVLLGGSFTSYNGSAAPAGVLRLNADGSLDTSFNNGGVGTNSGVLALAVQADGKVLAGGNFSSYNGNTAAPDRLLRLNADGSLNDAATALPGATFVFNPGGTPGATRTVSTAGTYSATATDPASGCAYPSNAVVVTTPAPTLSTLTPSSGAPGSTLAAAGTNLQGASAVTFTSSGGTATPAPAGYAVASDGTGITGIMVPAGLAAGAYTLTVTTPNGTSNGLAFTVMTAPTVATATPGSITTTSAVLGGTVTADGGAAVTDRGVVYSSTATTPTIGGTGVTKDANGMGTGTYSKTTMGLTSGTLYYVRAYATNSVGTSYGNVLTFTTPMAVTAAPVVIVPANGSYVSTATPPYGGTALAGAIVTVYVDGSALPNTTTANADGIWVLPQPTALTQGSHTVYATAQLSGQTVSANSNINTFTVDTVAPTVAISSTAGASGGTTSTSPIPFTVTFSESVTGFAASNVTVSNGTVSGFSGSGTTYSFNVTPTTAGTATTVSVAANVAQDVAGNGNTASMPYALTYQLSCVAPTISAITPGTNPQALTSAFTLTAQVRGANNSPSTNATATVNWGDGSAPTSAPIAPDGSLAASHTYATAGVYRLSLTATNACGTTTLGYDYAVIYDPSAGFVTGGGWITSPVNPALQYMQVGGKATFGFSAKYQKGSTQVVGDTQFKFEAGNLSFQSSSYTAARLVISGATANYKGVGTINGGGNYGFMVAALDGDYNKNTGPDKFRMKIWDVASGTVVYDNQAGAGEDAVASTVIGGGSIIIHNANDKSSTSSTSSLAATPDQVRALAQAPQFTSFPNPFAGQTTLAFVLADEQAYTLAVYDLRGALVQRIQTGQAQAGQRYEVVVEGQGLSSGLYVAQLTTATQVQTLKLVVQK